MAEVFSPHCAGSRKTAFTLAEVLITLGIIGIVAAMTMTQLITKYQKKVTVERLKSAYSTLEQAVKLSENYNGPVSEWEFDADFFDKYILPYMNVRVKNGRFSSTKGYNFKTINGDNCRGGFLRIMNNGVGFLPLISAIGSDGSLDYAWIIIDINGLKGPNRLGRDVFQTEIYRNKKLQMLRPNVTRNQLINETGYGCNKNLSNNRYYAGINCGALIMYDGWQITPDYPW